jgi:hypothetical protein
MYNLMMANHETEMCTCYSTRSLVACSRVNSQHGGCHKAPDAEGEYIGRKRDEMVGDGGQFPD